MSYFGTAKLISVPESEVAGSVRDWLLPCALMLQAVLVMSPLFPAAGIRGVYLYALVYAVTLFEMTYGRRTVPKLGIFMAGGVVLGSCLASLHWHQLKIAFLPYFFVGSVLLAGVVSRQDIQRFITLCTGFLLVMLVFSWIGFLFVLHGGEALFSIANPDGRENVFYLTTFSNWRVMDSIRPSGVFDEPGTFSFLLCALAALRRIYGRNEAMSLGLLVAGLVTFSFTHILFLTGYVLTRPDQGIRRNFLVFVIICVGVTLVYWFLLRSAIDAAIMWKLRYEPQTQSIAGDNRSAQVLLAQSRLNFHSFCWGLDPLGITRVHAFSEKYGAMTATPLGPLLTSGIFISFPYYFFIPWMVWQAVWRREKWIYLWVVLLFLPRPYVTSYGYAVWAMLFLFAHTRSDKSEMIPGEGISHGR